MPEAIFWSLLARISASERTMRMSTPYVGTTDYGILTMTQDQLYEAIDDAHTPFTVKAQCPHGTHVTGGGLYDEGGSDRIFASKPLDGSDADHKPDDGWRGTAFPEQDSEDVTTVAICAKGMKLRYVHDDATSTGTGTLSVTARCPRAHSSPPLYFSANRSNPCSNFWWNRQMKLRLSGDSAS